MSEAFGLFQGGFALLFDESAGSSGPTAFGTYRVLHQSGVGVLGPVFRAFDAPHDRLVAIKVFRLDLIPEDVDRLAEALRRLVAAPLPHFALVPLLDAGVEGSAPFLVSRYLTDSTLDVWLRGRAPLGVEEALPLLNDLASAIDAAHAGGLRHGALHPRDVFLSTDGALAALTGFGIVDALSAAGVRNPVVRRPYAAPERTDGAWDGRADVYSLAALAHEMMTGRRPLGVGEPDAAPAHDLSPSQRRVLAQGLAETAERRFPTAAAFVEALGGRGRRAPREAATAAAAVSAAAVEPDTPDTTPAAQARELPAVPDASRASDDSRVRHAPDAPGARDVSRAPDVSGLPETPAVSAVPDASWPSAVDDAPPRDNPFAALSAAAPDVVTPPAPAGADSTQPPQVEEEPFLSEWVPPSHDPAPARGPVPDVVAEPAHSAPADLLPLMPTRTPDMSRAPDLEIRKAEPDLPPLAPFERPPLSSAPPPNRSWPSVLAVAAAGLVIGVLGGAIAANYWRGQDAMQNTAEDTTLTALTPAEPLAPLAPPSSTTGGVPSASDPADSLPSPDTVSPGLDDENREDDGDLAESAPTSIEPPAARDARPAVVERGRLVVRSQPSGALVTIGGRLVGETPVVIDDLPVGVHDVQVARPGHAVHNERVRIGARAGVRTLSVILQPGLPAVVSTRGAIDVDSRPRGARVLVDGRFVGHAPLRVADLRAGAHEVTLELGGYQSASGRVQVEPGRAEPVRLTLRAIQ